MKGMHPLYKKWLSIFLGFLCVIVLIGGVVVGAFIGYIDSMEPLKTLENYNPAEIARVYDRTGNRQIGSFAGEERRRLVRIHNIPEHVIAAFLAIEDERFYQHFGIDVKGGFRALFENLRSNGRSQGASTITMQVARNVVLEDLSRTAMRKIKEIFLSFQIERQFSKDQILEFYLNHIFFGANSYGIQEASYKYFSKDVKDLTINEAAMLAGLPKAPSQLSPLSSRNKIENTKARRDLVLFNMQSRLKYNNMTKSELQRLQAMPIELNPAPEEKVIAPYFVDFVRSRMGGKELLGEKAYQVVSTVDLELQSILEEELSKSLRNVEKEINNQKPARFSSESSDAVKRGQTRLARITEVGKGSIKVSVGGYSATVPLPNKLPFFFPDQTVKKGGLIDIYIASVNTGKRTMEAYLGNKSHVQGAAVLVDVKSGDVLALVGGDDWHDSNAGQWNRAFMGGRQPGSCWKPLLFAGAFDATDKNGNPRFTPATIIQDERFSIGSWSPKNYESRYYGPTSLYHALVKSRNVPTVKLFMELGAEKSLDIYNKFNTVSQPSDWNLDRYAPMALGTPDITPLALASAYAALGNHGVGINPHPVKRLYSSKSVTDARKVENERYQVVSPQAAYMTTKILQDVVTHGTAKNTIGKWIMEQKKAGRSIPEVAAKTGTTNDCKVAWLVGYTPELALAVYVGYDESISLGPKMTGGTVVGPIWTSMMDRLLKTRNDWQQKFEIPADIDLRDICSVTGKVAQTSCFNSGQSVYKNAAFKKGTAPNNGCYGHGGGSGNITVTDDSDAESNFQYDQNPLPSRQQPAPQQPVNQFSPYGAYYGYAQQPYNQ